MQKLNIYFNNKEIGSIDIKDEFILNYTKEWIDNGFAISPHLPLNSEIKSNSIKNFLENLLPEGRWLDDIINYYRISKSDVVSIIKAIGFETSGALSFVKNSNGKVREISKSELIDRIDKIDEVSINFWDNKPRLSLAGVQDKLPVIYKNGSFALADGNFSSTHILKFQTKRYQNIVLNEYFCLKLAKSCKIEVANAQILKLDKHLVLLIERFDRVISGNRVDRLHLIDGCQLLDLPPSYKYERNFGSNRDVKHIRDGVSFKKLADALNLTKVPAMAKLKLIDWALFNLLIGNSDAHGKNISFYIDKNGLEIAPFYDILSTIVVDNIEHDLAMAFGEEFNISDIKHYDLECFADDLNVPFNLIKNRLNILIKSIKANIENINFDIDLTKNNNEFINYLKETILQRVKEFEDILAI